MWTEAGGLFGVRRSGVRIRFRNTRCARPALTAGLLLCLAALTCRGESPNTEATSPLTAAELGSLWDGQRSEIATAIIRFRCFNSTLGHAANTPERVAQVLREHDLAHSPQRLEACLLELNGGPFSRPQPWEDMTLTVSGRRRRFEDAFTTFVSDGEFEAALTPTNGQVDLLPVGKSVVHHYDLSDIRWTPPSRVSASTWEFLEIDGDEVKYRVPPAPGGNGSDIEVSVDSASGIITHKLTRRGDGTPAIELFQQGLVVHSSGVVFPTLRIDLQYHDGLVRTARVILLESAEFNIPVSDAAFALPIPKGTRIIDYRGTEKTASLSTRSEADALSLPSLQYTSPALPPERKSGSSPFPTRWTLLIAAHVAALLAAGTLVWQRRLRNSAHRR